MVAIDDVLPHDDAARRAFLRYRLVLGPFFALIRRRWLKQIARA
jgi:hypothetical protein